MYRKVLLILFVVVIGLAVLVPLFPRQPIRKDFHQQALESLKHYEADFTTPQGAILCIEEAYRNKDIEAVVACKDFRLEAELMFHDKDPNLMTEELIGKAAETLELAFRQQMEAYWPDFEGLESYFHEAEPYQDYENIVCVKEECRFPDGGYSEQNILVGKTDDGWRMLISID